MNMISLLAAMSLNRVIGKNNQLPWHLPNDLKYFKQLTQGKTIIMGRKTFDSIGRVLPNRHNVVITRDKNFHFPDVHVFHSVSETLRTLKEDEVFVIGGGELFNQFLNHAHRMYLTLIHAELEGDVFFPEINLQEWKEIGREAHFADEQHLFDYTFIIYQRI